MKNRFTKYILSLSVLLLALFSQYRVYSGSPDKAAAAHVISATDILEYNASHVSLATVTIVKENHETCLPSDTDNEEEEFSSHAKKLVKAAVALPSFYFQKLLPAAIGDSRDKSSHRCGQSTPFSPYRPYIRFRVIRI